MTKITALSRLLITFSPHLDALRELVNLEIATGMGVVGRRCRRAFLAVDALSQQVHPNRMRPSRLHPGVELIEKDIALSETWDQVFRSIWPDVVGHLASETGTAQSQYGVTLHARANVLGTAAML